TPNILYPTYQSFGLTSSSVFDLNHDGRADIIIDFPDGSTVPEMYSIIQFFRGQADGSFDLFVPNGSSIPRVPVLGTSILGIGWIADFDGDGFPDMLLISTDGHLTSNFAWIVLASSGGANFQVGQSLGVQMLRGGPGIAGVADLNGDGKLDLA